MKEKVEKKIADFNPLFKITDSISFDKVDYLRDGDSSTPKEKDYNSFMINKSLSYHPDCLGYVNEMNRLYNLDNYMQFDYLINTIRKSKRYGKKWAKPIKNENLELICSFFKVSERKAMDYLDILKENDFEEIKKKMDVGGLKNDRKKGD